jgi:hypothetical protein
VAEYQYVDAEQGAEILARAGVRRRPRTFGRWMRDHGIAVKLGGRWLTPIAAVDLFLAGIPLDQIAERLGNQCSGAAADIGPRRTGRRSTERGARRRM